MSRAAGRLSLITPPILLGVVLVVSCLGEPAGLRIRTARMSLTAAFTSTAAGSLDLDHVRVLFERTVDSSVALDTTVQLSSVDSVIDLTLSVPLLEDEQETFWVTIECYSSAGDLVFVGGPVEVTATPSADTEPAEVPIEIEYVGVGSDAVAVLIEEQESAVLFGDTVRLAATAVDDGGHVISGTPILWASLTPERATVPDVRVGRVIGGTERGVAQIEARLLTGPADTGLVLVQPAPTQLAAVQGDGQTGIVGTALRQPIVAQVTGEDDLGFAGATVYFLTADGGSFAQTSAVTDDEGRAGTSWILGSAEGTQTAIAALSGVGSPQASFTATATQPLLVQVSGDGQVGSPNQPLGELLVAAVTTTNGIGIPGLTVDFSTSDGGSFGQPSAVTDEVGQAMTTWILGPDQGMQIATATLMGFGNPQITYSATADSGRTATGNVLVLSNRYLSTIVDSFPVHMPGFTFDSMNVAGQTPTVEFLSQFPVVLLFEDGLFSNAVNVGDSVAAYVQAGGNLVLGTFYWQDRSDNPRYSSVGWGALEQIDPFAAPYGSEYRGDSLDTGSIVAHPLTQGLDSLWVNSYHGGVEPREGTIVVARWSDACIGCNQDTTTPLVGYRVESEGQRIVGVSLYPAYPYYGGFGGDFYRLWENALGWAIAADQGAPPSVSLPLLRSHPAPADTTSGDRRGGSGN
jgi:hypothetical protein